MLSQKTFLGKLRADMPFGCSLHEKPDQRTFIAFLILSWLCIFFAFRAALWGGAILAPMDIGPALYSKFKAIDPSVGDVPRNHYLIDTFDLMLPRQYIAHQAIQSGEFPWWEPYTHGGRPLAMEVHANLTDPIRLLLYWLLPWVAACNWTFIIHSFLTGLSMFLLLRNLGCSQFVTLLGALSFQFSGLQAIMFYPEFVANTLWYYPLLWIVFSNYHQSHPTRAVALGGVLCGASILSGSQQSHGWLVVFLGCVVLGYGLGSVQRLFRMCGVVAAAFLLGCALAAPILAPQVEIYMFSERKPEPWNIGLHLLSGVFSLSGIFPWLLGTFRTIDLAKLINQNSTGFVVFLGTPVMLLALVGLFSARKFPRPLKPELLTALILVFTYFVLICCTPLLNLFYLRSAGLAQLGLLILFGIGLDRLLQKEEASAKLTKTLVSLIAIALAAVHLVAFVIYPRIADRLVEKVIAAEARKANIPSVPEVRRFQVKNLPNEITFKNPEVWLSFAGAGLLLGLLSTRPGWRRMALAGVFLCNMLPLLLFFHRAIAYAPVAQWEAVLRGGPEQQRIMRALGEHGRYDETASTRLDYAIPAGVACLYRVHSLKNYTTWALFGPGQTKSEREINVHYISEGKTERGELEVVNTNLVRFAWKDASRKREVQIVSETLNTIHLRIGPGAAGTLVRTDTYYPGWRVKRPPTIAQGREASGFLSYAIPAEATDLTLEFRHRYSEITKWLSIAGILALGLLLITSFRQPVRKARSSLGSMHS